MNKVSPPPYAGPPPGSPEQVRAILAELWHLYPDAKISLNFSNPLELLVATQLSAQSTDERVNRVTTDLFQKYRSVEDYATVSQEELEKDIQSTGFYHSKAKNIRAAAQRILTHYGGEVPPTMEALVTLPGVGRKNANVGLGNAFGVVEGIVVDILFTWRARIYSSFGQSTCARSDRSSASNPGRCLLRCPCTSSCFAHSGNSPELWTAEW